MAPRIRPAHDSAPNAVSRLGEWAPLNASGEIELPSGDASCEVSVTPEGLTARDGERVLASWPAHEILNVAREDYDLQVTNVFTDERITLRRFARRTDELESTLRRSRADALAGLMAPPAASLMDVFEAQGERPGLLYRYDDGLRWVPHSGNCCSRVYSEISDARFEPATYEFVLSGPFGETRIGGLKRLTRELAEETTRHIGRARAEFADALEAAGLPWGDEARDGTLAAHVPFEASEESVSAIRESRIVCDERREYFDILVDEQAIERVVLGLDPDLRAVALGPARDGELYEALSESEHASFVFQDADAVVQAWVEAGFRREPIFSPSDQDAAAALARVLPSLNAARRGLMDRVIHDEPESWRKRLYR